MSAEYCAYSKHIHLDCFIICMCIQIASFTTATLSGPLSGEIQRQLLTDSSFSTNSSCRDTVQGTSLRAKAAFAVKLFSGTMAVARSDA